MSKNAPRHATNVDSIPSVVGNWEIEIPAPAGNPLFGLTSIQISYQEHGDAFDRIFGSISSSPPQVTSYAIMDGQVTRPSLDTMSVNFVVRMNGTDYRFTGTLEPGGQDIIGSSPAFPLTDGHGPPGHGDGSWSAQAQSGG
jgi:hypothetical protein